NTNVYLDFLNNNRAEEYNFITFIDRRKQQSQRDTTQQQAATPSLLPANEGAELRMNFMLDITPDAQIELIMDPVAGDRIKGTANGNLQVQYGTKTDLRMYGTVGIIEGKYNFSLQQVIRKDFKIRDGSTIRFHGDPFNADMNIDAIYSLTANLSDLDQSVALESPRQNVPVNCVLNLNGLLRNPTITFNLELPNSNEELERQVRSLVDTEDMMSRQIVYLLVLNKFYTPNYTDGYRGNELNAVASSAISSQISSLLGSFTDKVQIGANIRADRNEFSNQTEMEMLLSSQLFDNRLLINGNFGYRNSIYTNQKNVFIGEFDLEYKLTRNGEISLKAYNHSNDNNLYQYMKQSLTTQGVGIKFQKEFSHLSEFFRRRRLLLPTVMVKDSLPAEQP
ncbi:MAG: translocation/assembly module TamB domain-containing protein, partial [Parabacteroides sp.]